MIEINSCVYTSAEKKERKEKEREARKFIARKIQPVPKHGEDFMQGYQRRTIIAHEH